MDGNTKHFRKRDAILTCLRQTKTHPSADWVYAQLKPEIPDLSLGTVYRNLARFREQGLIVSLGTVRGVERFDAQTHDHVHFICTQCGSVEDLAGVSLPQSLSAAAAKSTGGRLTGYQLTFTGQCRCCQNSHQEVTV